METHLLWTKSSDLSEPQAAETERGSALTQLFFFFFLESWSFRLPMLDMLVRLLRLEMLSHEF